MEAGQRFPEKPSQNPGNTEPSKNRMIDGGGVLSTTETRRPNPHEPAFTTNHQNGNAARRGMASTLVFSSKPQRHITIDSMDNYIYVWRNKIQNLRH
jgi:hypothetical protein